MYLTFQWNLAVCRLNLNLNATSMSIKKLFLRKEFIFAFLTFEYTFEKKTCKVVRASIMSDLQKGFYHNTLSGIHFLNGSCQIHSIRCS